MARSVTFVLIGKRRGTSVNVGPQGRYKFRGGEMKVSEYDASAMTRALSHYAAYPKGDADKFHKALCAKQGIDPETLEPVTASAEPVPAKPAEPEPAKPAEIEPEPAKPAEPEPAPANAAKETLTGDKLRAAVAKILETVDHADDKCWIGAGTVSVFWVNEQLPNKEGASRKLLDTFNITRKSS